MIQFVRGIGDSYGPIFNEVFFFTFNVIGGLSIAHYWNPFTKPFISDTICNKVMIQRISVMQVINENTLESQPIVRNVKYIEYINCVSLKLFALPSVLNDKEKTQQTPIQAFLLVLL